MAQDAPKEWGLLHCRAGGETGDDMRLHAKWNFADYLYHAFTIHGMEGHLELSGDIGGEELSPGRSYLRLVRGKKAEEIPFQCPPVPVTLEVQDRSRPSSRARPTRWAVRRGTTCWRW